MGTIKSTLALDGETKLKDALKNIENEYRILNSEMAKVTAGFDSNDKSAEKLTEVNKVLGKEIDLQKQRVAELANALKQAEEAHDTQAITDYQVKLNKAEAALISMERKVAENERSINQQGEEAQQTAGQVNDYTDKTTKATKETGDFTEKLKNATSALGNGLLAAAKGAAVAVGAVAAATGAAIKGLVDAAGETGKWADDLLTMSSQTGIAVGTLQELQYASRFVDVEVETMTNGMAKLVKQMGTAQKAGDDYVAVTDDLKLSMMDSNGQLKTSEQMFYDSIDAIGALKNETEQEIAAQKLFGKSYQDIMPLIKAGSGALTAYADEAKKMGLVLSDEMVAKMGAYDDIMQKTEAQMDGLKKQLVVNFMPALQGAATGLSELLSEVGTALADGFQPNDIQKIGGAISKKLADGIKTISQYIPAIVSTIADTLVEAIDIVVGLMPTLLPALVDGAMQLIEGLMEAIQMNVYPLADTVVYLLTSFADLIIDNLPIVILIALQLILALADGLVEAIPELIPAIVDIVKSIGDMLITHLPLLIDATIAIVMALVNGILDNLPELIKVQIEVMMALIRGLIDALPQLIEWLPTIVKTIVQVIIENLPLLIDATIEIILAIIGALIENLPLIFDAAVEIIMALLAGLINALPELLLFFPKMFSDIQNKFKEYDWKQLGIDILHGIADGFMAGLEFVLNAARDAADSILNTFKNIFDINSPSRVMRDMIGVNLGKGIAEGIDKSNGLIDEAIGRSLPDIERKYNVAFAADAVAAKRAQDAASATPVLDIDYDRLANAMAKQQLVIDGRGFGRLVKAYA